MSQFTHAGVSKLNGEYKVRFCNDGLRVKVSHRYKNVPCTHR